MKDNLKIVIVGAGPAGISTALTLKKNNIDCLLIDSKKFPRNKTCGGLLTKKTINLINQIIKKEIPSFIINSKIKNVQIKNNNETIADLNTKEFFNLTSRENFDNWFLNEYKKIGGKILEETKLLNIDKKNKIIYCSNNQKFKYDILIGSDGCNSIVRKNITKKNMNVALGIETRIDINKININKNKIILDVGLGKDGYLWIFPEKEYVNIGFASTYDKNINYKKILEDYLLKNYNYKNKLKITGAFLPYGNNKMIYGLNDTYLIGDACGLTDTITGEGLYYAIYSGKELANIIVNFKSFDKLKKEYKKIINQIHKQIKKSTLFKIIFYHNKNFILNKVKLNPLILKKICDNQIQINKYNYSLLKILIDKGEIK